MLLRLERLWHELRMFSYRNRTLVEVLFLLLYSIEQIMQILLTVFYPYQINLIVSSFAVVILATFGLHKYAMESRIRILEKELDSLKKEYHAFIKSAEHVKRNIFKKGEENVTARIVCDFLALFWVRLLSLVEGYIVRR